MRFLFTSLLLAAAALAPRPNGDWPMHGRDAGAVRYSPLTQIDTGNVSTLQIAWTYATPAPVQDDGRGGRGLPAGRGGPAGAGVAPENAGPEDAAVAARGGGGRGGPPR